MTKPISNSDHFRATLLTLQGELLAVSSTGQEAAQTVELDHTTIGRVSRMDALQQQAMAQAAQQRRHIQLQRIESALQRLENGKFGWCMRCGEEISRKRLEVDPTAPLCIACADGRNR
ncbi:MAG: TraR/DksA family transcriptional regulator [Nitrospirales bacterium]|nr:TraR/DksA family transcriptional regulator [Nitrospirales bacterium]